MESLNLQRLDARWNHEPTAGFLSPTWGEDLGETPPIQIAQCAPEPERGIHAASTSLGADTRKRHECRAPMAVHGQPQPPTIGRALGP